MVEPGLDHHGWGEWEQLEPLLHGSPEEALPGARHLLERMLEERGVVDDEVVTIERGDLDSAAATLHALYEHLVNERSAP
jgi:hypothetical protein